MRTQLSDLNQRNKMGLAPTPADAAPSYEDIFHNHPVNQTPPSGSSSSVRSLFLPSYLPSSSPSVTPIPNNDQYAPVPSTEEDFGAHAHSTAQLQILNEPDSSNPHTHCELCDKREDRKANRRKELCCCALVAATFMVAFFVAFLIVEVVVTRGR